MAKRKNGRVFLGLAYMTIGCFLIYTLMISVTSIFEQKDAIQVLEEQKKALEEEKTTLETEIELLNDPDYVTRYARENYIFIREGEKVVPIPSIEE